MYVAMEYGPIPSKTYDILKNEPLTLSYLGITELPFERSQNIIKAKRKPNVEEFSESDIEALQRGWSKVKDKSFDQIKDNLHEHEAYGKKWNNPERITNSVSMDFEDMIDNDEIKEELSCTAKFIKL